MCPRVHKSPVKRGSLVTFEGLDGCGKSTQCARLHERLEADGVAVVSTREPTDGEWGQRIRAMARSGDSVSPQEELAWFIEDRREHVSGVIEPALAEGSVVLCDRYYHSTVAYQGSRGLDPWELLAEAEAAFPVPDRTLLFSLPVLVGLERVRTRGGIPEPAFERQDFLERVAAVYGALAERREAIMKIDAEGSEDEVAARVVAVWELGR